MQPTPYSSRAVQVATCLALFVGGGAVVASEVNAAPTEPNTLINPLAIPGDCNYCHRFNNDLDHLEEPAFAPIIGWSGTMMANAARDPVFWAGIAIADQDAPGETEVCIRCHSPRAFLEGRGAATTQAELDPRDMDGVTCMVCHRMQDDGELGNAGYSLDDTLVNGTMPRRGPFDYTDGVPAPDQQHSTIPDPFTGSSELCGTCHDVTTSLERVDDNGDGMGTPFNEQRTYSEWANSSFAQPGDDFRSCQDCHMAEVPDSAACRDYAGVESHAEGNRRHDLLGANRFMLEILRDNYAAEVLPDFFNNAIARMDEFLVGAATLEVVAPASVDITQGIGELTATVTNNTGHKLPTGYSEGRIMWIEVVATYDEQVVYSSGTWDQGAGTIEQDDQLHTYEAIGEEFSSGAQFHLLRNNYWAVDSRIPPLGLTQDIQTDPVGERYAMQDDGTWPNFDTTNYTFAGRDDIDDATPDVAGDEVLNVSVRVLYLINTPEYVQFLAEGDALADGSEAGTELAAMFADAGGATPLVLAQQDLEIPLTGFAAASSTGQVSSGGPSTSGVPSTSTTAQGTSATGSSGSAVDDDDGGCGCQSGSRGAGWMFLLVPIVALRRRRR